MCGYRQQPVGIRSIQHGKKYEKQALKDYARKHMSICGGKIEVESRGLVVNPKFLFLGASVDGYLTCSICEEGIVEVKCPYGSNDHPRRNMTPDECARDQNFFCSLSDSTSSTLKLKEKHNYMFQIQGQIAILNMQWVDFVVWTKNGISYSYEINSEATSHSHHFKQTGSRNQLDRKRWKSGFFKSSDEHHIER